MVVRSTVGLGGARPRIVPCCLLSSNPRLHDGVACIAEGVSPSDCRAGRLVLLTDVGRKLRQERFASALLVL
jgi:hypothetical protein